MDAKSLRLGNWVLVENDYEEVVGINKYEITCRLDETSHGVNQSIKDIKPITLTEEWLIRFGFKLTNQIRDEKVYSINGYMDVYVMNNKFSFEPTSTFIKYVHQLQNIYFSLNEKELVLN